MSSYCMLTEFFSETLVGSPRDIFIKNLRSKLSQLDDGSVPEVCPPGNKLYLQAAELPKSTLWFSPPEQLEVNVLRYLGRWSLSGQGFATAFCNIAVTSGKWAYEVALCGDGLMQIGWSIPSAFLPCDPRFGVGDFPFTFGYDGYRQAVWNVKPSQCGPRWTAGDIVTCLIDVEQSEVKVGFLLNGVMVHSASFSPLGAPCVYVPAITLGQYEGCLVTVGAAPLKYSIEGYSALESVAHVIDKWLRRLEFVQVAISLPEALPELPLLAASIFEELNSVTQQQLSGFCTALYQVLLKSSPGTSKMQHLCRLLNSVLRPKIPAVIFGTIIAEACFDHSVRLLSSSDPRPSPELELVAALVEIPSVCVDWSAGSSFSIDLLNLFRIKPPNPSALEALFPRIPIESDVSEEGLQHAAVLENMYANCVSKDDGARRRIVSSLAAHPAAVVRFHEFLDLVIRDLRDRPRSIAMPMRRQSALAIDGSVAGRLFIALAALIAEKIRRHPSVGATIAVFCPRRVLASSTIERLEIARLGGSFQYVSRSRPYHVGDEGNQTAYDPLLIKASLIFVSGAKIRVHEACEAILARTRLRDRLRDPEDRDATLLELSAVVRRCAWDSATLFYVRDHPNFMQVCSSLAEILTNYVSTPVFPYIPTVMVECFVDLLHLCRRTAQDFAPLVTARPKCISIFFRLYMHNDIQQDTNEYLMGALAAILDTNELHRQEVVSILQSEWAPFSHFLQLVLSQFGHRIAWTLVVGTMVRFSLGNCFALSDDDELINYSSFFPHRKRQKVSVPTAFQFYRTSFRQFFEQPDGQQSATASERAVGGPPEIFLRRLIDHTNFAITELGAALNDVQLTKQDRALTHEMAVQRRKCSSLFELAKNLLHIVEFTLDAVPDLLFAVGEVKNESRLMFTRMVVEIIGQCLARFAAPSPSVALTRVVQWKLRGLERVQQWRLLAPVIGCLYNMTNGGKSLDPKTNIFLNLFSKPGIEWSIEQLRFAFTGFDWQALENQGPVSLISKSEFTRDEDVLQSFEKCYAAKVELGKNPILDDSTGEIENGICLICAFAQIDATFEPCGHCSCMACIRRHMLSSEKCFFCNKKVEDVVSLATTIADG